MDYGSTGPSSGQIIISIIACFSVIFSLGWQMRGIFEDVKRKSRSKNQLN